MIIYRTHDVYEVHMGYQHFNITESPKVVAQCGVCAATSAAKQSVVILVHEKTFRDLGSGFVAISIIGASLNVF